MTIEVKSKEQLDSEMPKFALLKHDDYELVIKDFKLETRAAYQNPSKMEEQIDFTLEVVGYKDGEPAVDEDNKPADNRKVFFTLRTGHLGIMADGTPSKGRCFLAYAMGLEDALGSFTLSGPEELIGKTVYAEIIQYKNQKGAMRNKIVRFVVPPRKKK